MSSRALARAVALIVAPALAPAVLARAVFAHAAPARNAMTPLEEAQLFISPCGEPFRSKPGEPYPVVAWFRQTDTNKDGRVDRAEFRARCEIVFHALDLDHDGVLEDDEINFYERRVAPEISAGIEGVSLLGGGAHLIPVQLGGGGVDPGGGSAAAEDQNAPKEIEDDGPPQGAAPYGLLNDPEPIRSAARKLDNRVTLADFMARTDEDFDQLDPDKRGYLTLESLPQTPVQRLARVKRGS